MLLLVIEFFLMSDSNNWSDKEIISAFFKMLRTVVIWVIWLVFTLFWAVSKDLAFFDDPHIPLWAHILFFAWVIITLPLIVWITGRKIWHIF